jgi:hypothetical protein
MARQKRKLGTKHPKTGKYWNGKRWVTKTTWDLQRLPKELTLPKTDKIKAKSRSDVLRKKATKGEIMEVKSKSKLRPKTRKGGAIVKRPSSAIVKRKSSAITKAKKAAIQKFETKGGYLTKRGNKLARSTSANTSKDTVRASGTRTGRPGPTRKALKPGTQKLLPSKSSYKSPKAVTSAKRQAARDKQAKAARGSKAEYGKTGSSVNPRKGQPVNRVKQARRFAEKHAPKVKKAVKSGGTKLSKLASKTGAIGKYGGRLFLLAEAKDKAGNVVNMARNLGKGSREKVRGTHTSAQIHNKRREWLLKKDAEKKKKAAAKQTTTTAVTPKKVVSKPKPVVSKTKTKTTPSTPKKVVSKKAPVVNKAQPKKVVKKKKPELDQWGRPKYYKGTKVERSNVFSKHAEGVMTRNQRRARDFEHHKRKQKKK